MFVEQNISLTIVRHFRSCAEIFCFTSPKITEKVILTDLGTEGVWNALIFSPQGNLLFPVSSELPVLRDIQALGLPLASADGAVVDFDGDGFRDVLAVPQGIFRRDGDHFEATEFIDLKQHPTLISP